MQFRMNTLSSAAITPPPLPPPLYSMAQMLPMRLCTNLRLTRVTTCQNTMFCPLNFTPLSKYLEALARRKDFCAIY